MNEYKNRKIVRDKSSKYKIMEVINSEGFDIFRSDILLRCDKESLDFFEMYFINKYESFKDDIGYNSFHITNFSLESKMSLSVSNITKEKMSKSHIGLIDSANTKRKKSNKIYAINESEIIISDSGKLLADHFGKSKDYIKNCLRQPSSISGYRLYYVDINKRHEIKNKMLKKRCIRDTKYMEILDYLDNSSVETIKNDYNVKLLCYNDE